MFTIQPDSSFSSDIFEKRDLRSRSFFTTIRFLLVWSLFVGSAHLLAIPAKANEETRLELASPFVDHAILQREQKLPVWGWAEPGKSVAVGFAGQSKNAVADKKGRWSIKLDPLKASNKESQLVVSCGNQKLVRKGILVGEVWFSSGQSNMDWIASKSMCRDLVIQIQRSKEEIPIREYNVDIGSSIYPQDRAACKDGWKKSNQAGNFSALSLAFAWSLYEELQVPIGILRCTHGATPIETWTAYEGFANHPQLQDYALRIRQNDPRSKDSKAAFEDYFDSLRTWQKESAELLDRGGVALNRPSLPGIADDWKGPSRMFNKKIAPVVPYGIKGAIWCQGESNSADGKIYAAKMEALVDGWRRKWNRPDLPFYFTQMQCYGEPNPDNVGFGDIREAQTLFFRRAKNVGMAAQHDLNPARPTGIHPYNKLDPGKRLARWALAKQYGKKIPFTGPIYKSHVIEDGKVRIQFDTKTLYGGLMVGTKGLESDASKNPDAFVEAARESKGVPLQHFRLAGKDKKWYPATAVIKDNEVWVSSDKVPSPVGVQYAYSASPIGANLYNRAGLPAIPFACFDGKQMFNEDDAEIVAAAKAEAERRWGKKTYLLPSTLLRDRAVLQRNTRVPIWGHGVPGTEITVQFAGQEKKTRVGEFEKWRVTLDPIAANEQPEDLVIKCSNGESRTIRQVLVGDVWVITGARKLASDLIRPDKGSEKVTLKALPLVREFRIKTKARRFRTPRKLRMEIGGGRYVASWQPADFDDVGDPPSVVAYHFAKKVLRPGIPVGIITLGAENPPLTWVSPKALQKSVGFEKAKYNLDLTLPNTKTCKQAVEQYISKIDAYLDQVSDILQSDKTVPAELADAAPAFPQPFYDQWASRTETATHTYNFCISPLVPYGVKGMLWIPDKDNISDDVKKYSPALSLLARNLDETFEQKKVHFLYVQPDQALVEGIAKPELNDAPALVITEWPKTFQSIAEQLGEMAIQLK